MDKKEIFEILMQAGSSEIKAFSGDLKKEIPFEVIKKPEEGLIMFRMRESAEDIKFNVGEILVIQAEVRVKNSLGYAMVIGMNGEDALDKAFLMAVAGSDLAEKNKIEELALYLKEERNRKQKNERKMINSTRVQFETMGGQDPNVSHNKKNEEEES